MTINKAIKPYNYSLNWISLEACLRVCNIKKFSENFSLKIPWVFGQEEQKQRKSEEKFLGGF